MRIAALTIPLFPLAARLRIEPEVKGEAVVIVEGNAAAARVVAASRAARQAGIVNGHGLAQARALIPQLLHRPRDSTAETAATGALFNLAQTISPQVEMASESSAWAELSGLERHYRREGEHQLAREVLEAGALQGLPLRLGIAGSKLAASVAASLPHTPHIVPQGEEAAFLAPLPLTRLAPEVAVAETLKQWGIHTIGALASLPAADISSRLGQKGESLHAAARGFDPRPLTPEPPPTTFEEGLELEWPLVTLEPFIFLAQSALERLGARLSLRGLACTRLDLTLTLEPEGFCERSLNLPAPSRDPKTLLTLIRLNLERTPPGGPVTAFAFTAHPDRPPEAQQSLFGPTNLPPDLLATTIARLFALLGEGRIGAPTPVDSHLPKIALKPFKPPPAPTLRPQSPRARGLLHLRTLRPPIPVEVLHEDQSEAEAEAPTPPQRLSTPPSKEKRHRVDGKVRVASGPWNLEEEWWRESPVQRVYWDVELMDGRLYRLYQEEGKAWYVDGVYD